MSASVPRWSLFERETSSGPTLGALEVVAEAAEVVAALGSHSSYRSENLPA